MIKILAIGDIMGRSGREALLKYLPKLKEEHAPDLIVVNGENSAAGFGINAAIAADFFAAGVHCITLGNHSFDQKESLPLIDQDPRIVRPINYPKGTIGRGFAEFQTAQGAKIVVAQALGRLYMDPMVDDPFTSLAQLCDSYRGSGTSLIIDFHAEASSEKMALAHYLDGKAALIFGTHTHIPTADAQILPQGTGYQSDLGMTGDYYSVIGMDKAVPVAKFTQKHPTGKMTPAAGEASLCGLIAQIDQGRCQHMQSIIIGGVLKKY